MNTRGTTQDSGKAGIVSAFRWPFFVVATLAMLLAVLCEVGSSLALGGDRPSAAAFEAAVTETGYDVPEVELTPRQAPPGLAIPYLAFLDGLALFTLALIGLSLLLPQKLHGRIQGTITAVFTFFSAIAAVLGTLAAITLLVTMVGLFVAVPFGTVVYLAVWGFFDRGGAAAVLGVVLLLKLVVVGGLVLAQQRFLENKGLVLLLATSLVANLLVTFLQGLPPGVLVSITDALAAIVVGAVAFIWAIVMFFGGIKAAVKAFKRERSAA